MFDSRLKHLVQISIAVRSALILAVSLVNFLFEDFDSSTWIRNTATTDENDSPAWTLSLHAINGLNKWDSVYFNEISVSGYTYEQMLAFAPGSPYLVYYVSLFIKALPFTFSSRAFVIQAVGVVVNSFLQGYSVVILYLLTYRLFSSSNREKLALNHRKRLENYVTVTVIAFIFNPANIFMTSSYSESLFVAVQFTLCLALEAGHFTIASLLVGFSTVVRSNGLLNIFFIIYAYLKHCLRSDNLFVLLKLEKSLLEILYPCTLVRFVRNTYMKLLVLIFLVSVSLAPYIFFQYQIYKTFCEKAHVVNSNHMHWCKQRIPLAYSYIQSHYWNVGFLRYFEWKQAPNFALATPICFLVFSSVRCIVNDPTFRPSVLNWLGMKRLKHAYSTIFPPDRTFVYMCHTVLLALFGLLSIHVQVLTRMLCSSSPFVYWLVTELILSSQGEAASRRKYTFFILTFFISFNIFGIFLHCNFYPWT